MRKNINFLGFSKKKEKKIFFERNRQKHRVTKLILWFKKIENDEKTILLITYRICSSRYWVTLRCIQGQESWAVKSRIPIQLWGEIQPSRNSQHMSFRSPSSSRSAAWNLTVEMNGWSSDTVAEGKCVGLAYHYQCLSVPLNLSAHFCCSPLG